MWVMPHSALLAQDSTSVPRCAAKYATHRSCALATYGLTRLSDTALASGDRELRLWIESGIFLPERLVILRERNGRVTGEAYRWWTGLGSSDSAFRAFVAPHCRDLRTNGNAGMCRVRQTVSPPWAAALETLDSLGVGVLPDQSTIPSDGRFTRDGFTLRVEVLDFKAYRAYEYQNPAGYADSLNRRAAAMMQLVSELADPSRPPAR